ncbi:MAG: hypothetical protein IPN19_12860 [Elusimicrobia bacterium]|nr:hypothetical protein [Elusimicrobiota bacterium]
MFSRQAWPAERFIRFAENVQNLLAAVAGEPHTTVVLTASVQGRTRLDPSPDRVGLAREWTERYRQFRQARDWWVKWQRRFYA